MSIIVKVKKINMRTKTVETSDEHVVMEVPVNISVNDNYVITLLATPEFKKELVLGWLFDEGVLQSIDEVTEIIENQDMINVKTKDPIEEEKLRVVSVSRLLTTACGLSASKFFNTISEVSDRYVK
jgi:FdhD protein